MELLIAALVIALVAFLCVWLIDQVGLPHPINMIGKAIVVLIAVLMILSRAGIGF